MNAPPIFPWRLILASASPRRRALLTGLDLPVEFTQVDIDETPPPNMPARQVAEAIAVKKSEAWKGVLEPDQVLVTADTTVLVDRQILNKPANEMEARQMLTMLSGREHRVLTGVCLRTTQTTVSFTDIAVVRFRAMDAVEIAYYVDRHKPMDKAGAYGVQDWIGYTAVERIEGSFYTVMGLPMHRVYWSLRALPVPGTTK